MRDHKREEHVGRAHPFIHAQLNLKTIQKFWSNRLTSLNETESKEELILKQVTVSPREICDKTIPNNVLFFAHAQCCTEREKNKTKKLFSSLSLSLPSHFPTESLSKWKINNSVSASTRIVFSSERKKMCKKKKTKEKSFAKLSLLFIFVGGVGVAQIEF